MNGLLKPSRLLLSSTLLLGACTETIYREIPQYVVQPTASTEVNQQQVSSTTPLTESTSPTIAVPNNMAATNTATNVATPTQPTTTAQTNATTEPFSDGSNVTDTQPAAINENLSNVAAGTVAGMPGQSVDCQNTLPCRWISADGQLAVTATNADNIASRDRLSVSYTISTIHDTQLVMGSVDDAVDSDLIRYQATDLTLAGGNGGTPVTAQAGRDTLGVINYDESASGSSLSYWAVTLLDGGLVRKALFSGLPVGSVTNDYAQCNLTLPCVWASPDGQVTITLLSVGGFAGNGRMTANFSIQSARDMSIAVDAGASAIGADGTRFEGRTHTLGVASDYEKITEENIANMVLNGSVSFYRTETNPSSLVNLSLIMYEDAPTQRWNPNFESVPVQ